MTLLEKTRKINHLLQSTKTQVDFNEMARTLRDVIQTNTFVVSRRGKILGLSLKLEFENERMQKMFKTRQLPETYTKHLFSVTETSPNLDVNSEFTGFPYENKDLFVNGLTTVVPIVGGGERLGTLILSRLNETFTDEDLILAEYGATVVGMEILREKTDEVEEEARENAIVHMAIKSLSFSETEAIEHIFEQLNGKEGLLVASKVADSVGITRSVIVNALRKLQSAGVIESRSLGMKGTFIKVLNDKFLTELNRLKTE